jgi:hypothetical protein
MIYSCGTLPCICEDDSLLRKNKREKKPGFAGSELTTAGGCVAIRGRCGIAS